MHHNQYKFCPHCAELLTHQQNEKKTHTFCQHCGWIYYQDPKVAVAALIRREDEILLVQRGNKPHRGKWSLPAGFMDAHETPQEALKRECLEETGLAIEIKDLVEIISGREHSAGADVLLIYDTEVISGDLQAGDDAQKATFFSLSKLPKMAFQAKIEFLKKSN